MKKIIKTLAVLLIALGMCVGIGVAAGCTGGNGTFEGGYHYNSYGTEYGMRVEVTVKNNVITKVMDITNTDLSKQDNVTWVTVSPARGNWTEETIKNWNDNESYLLQKYEGWSVRDILDIQVFIKDSGEPYGKDKNNGYNDLLITGATLGSSRVLLAVQNALGKTIEIGRVKPVE